MSQKNSLRFAAVALSLATILGTFGPHPAQALNVTWNVNGNGDWDTTSTNWTGDSTVYAEGDNVTFNSSVTPGVVTLTSNHAPTSTTFSHTSGTYALSGSNITSGTLSKSGAGTLVLNSQFTGTGAITLAGGTLRLGASDRISDTALMGGSGVLDMNGFNETLRWTSGSWSVINMGNLTINGGNDYGGAGWSGSGSLTFGTGHLTSYFNGIHTYTGGTTVLGGQLNLYSGNDSSGVLPVAGAVTVMAPGTLNLNYHQTAGITRTYGALSGNGNVLTSTTNLQNTILRVGNGNGSGNWAGVYSGAGSLVKLGTGTQVFSGNNNYTGTTNLVAGRLTIDGVSGPNQGNYSVQSNATLAGAGTIGLAGGNAVTVLGGGTIEAATANGLTINGGLTLNTGTTLEIAVGGGSDNAIDVNGLVTGPAGSGGITLALADAGAQRGVGYTLLEWNSAADLSLVDFAVDAGTYTNFDLEIIGNALVFTIAVPEPSTCLLLGLGTLGLVCQLRRRKSRIGSNRQ